MGGSEMNQAFWTLMLFSVWNLLILLAIWRVSVRSVEHARRDAIAQTTSLLAQRYAAEPKKRAPRKTTVVE